MRRVIVLAGAPDPETIDWSSTDLLDHFTGAFARFAGRTEEDELPTQPDGPRWRALPAVHGLPFGRAEFLVTTQSQSFLEAAASSTLPSIPMSFQLPQALPATRESQEMESTLPFDDETTLSAFLEHSLAAHNELPSSLPDLSELQGRQDDADDDGDDTYDQTTSFGAQSDVSCVPSTQSQTDRPALPARWGPLTDLEAIPAAAYLVSIAPQTATISTVVGVISVAAPRQVHTRWGSTSSLVEVVVGDDTRAGFAVSFWVAASTPSSLPPLQPRDVVLLRHVALHVFDDRVYGSSLRKDQTKVQVLWRAGDDAVSVFSPAELGRAARTTAGSRDNTPDARLALAAKTARVRTWALRCIAGGGEDRPQRTWDMPPADTQE